MNGYNIFLNFNTKNDYSTQLLVLLAGNQVLYILFLKKKLKKMFFNNVSNVCFLLNKILQ